MLDELTKHAAHRLLTFVESGLVSYKHIHPWADSLIERLSYPPGWLCELSVAINQDKIREVLRAYVYSEPFVEFQRLEDLYVACLFLRHERGEISWATFLGLAGEFADASGCLWDCSEFYEFLNELEDADYSGHVAHQQCNRVSIAFQEALADIRTDYEALLCSKRNAAIRTVR